MYGHVLHLLKQRGLTVTGREFTVQDDGAGPYLARWDAALGPQPTPAEIAGVTEADAAAAIRDTQAADIESNLLIQAVAQLDWEERQKLQVKAGQTLLTAAQTKARIRAIYRGLLP